MSERGISAMEMQAAHDEWGANCGPASIAVALGISLSEVRPHMGDFEQKRYTSPTMMWNALRSLGVRFSYRGGHLGKVGWPQFGLARIQWEGPWMREGVPIQARYRHTHWVAVDAQRRPDISIFDCNATGNGTGWCSLRDWSSTIVPWILAEAVLRADGKWHITHAVEIAADRAKGGRDE